MPCLAFLQIPSTKLWPKPPPLLPPDSPVVVPLTVQGMPSLLSPGPVSTVNFSGTSNRWLHQTDHLIKEHSPWLPWLGSWLQLEMAHVAHMEMCCRLVGAGGGSGRHSCFPGKRNGPQGHPSSSLQPSVLEVEQSFYNHEGKDKKTPQTQP